MSDYVQCKLVKGKKVEISWIPGKYAVVGKVLRIKHDDKWSDGWAVTETYGNVPAMQVRNMSNYWRHHREATDI